MAEILGAIGRGLGQGASGIGDAILRVANIHAQRDQRLANERMRREAAERAERGLDLREFGARLSAMSTPGVNRSGAGEPIGAIADNRFFYDPSAVQDRYTVPGLGMKLPATDEGFQRGVQLRSQMGLIDSPDARLKPWESAGFDSKDEYLAYVQEKGAAGRRPRSNEPDTPTFNQALGDIVNPQFQTGTELTMEGEVPQFSLPHAQRVAKADSIAQGTLPVSEFAARHAGPARSRDPSLAEGAEPEPAPLTPDMDRGSAEASEPTILGEPVGEWVRVAGAAITNGMDEDTVRTILTNKGLSDEEAEAVLSRIGD